MQLYHLVAKVLDVEPVLLNDESNAQNTPKWDSLRHIEVLFAIENAFHIRFTMPEISGLRKLGDIRKLLATKNIVLNAEAADDVRKFA